MAGLIVNNWGGYEIPFEKIGATYNIDIAEELDSMLDVADFVVFTGGTDINPELYNEPRHPATSPSDHKRDKREVEIFQLALNYGIPMVGICRGAQFLCAMNGGKLHQDVRGHTRTHLMFTKKRRPFLVSSTHHQMMRPNYHRATLLGWGDQGALEDLTPEPEVVWWKDSACLGIQYHPEYLDPSEEAFKYAVTLTRALLNGEDLSNA